MRSLWARLSTCVPRAAFVLLAGAVLSAAAQGPAVSAKGPSLSADKAGQLSAQTSGTVDLTRDRELLTPLDGLWRFRPGDDPAFARPEFDDSSWAWVHGDRTWEKEGYKNLSGYGWYRLKLDVPAGTGGPLAIYVPLVRTNFQLFVDGQLVGGCEGLQPKPQPTWCHPMTFPMPKVEGATEHQYTIALRVWHWPIWSGYYGGGPRSALYAGSEALIAEHWTEQRMQSKVSFASAIFIAVLDVIGMLAAGALFVLSRRDREYLWFAMVLAANALATAVFVWYRLYFPRPMLNADLLAGALSDFESLASIGLFYVLLHARRSTWFYLSVAAIAVNLAISVFVTFPTGHLILSVGTSNLMSECLISIVNLWIIQLVVRRLFQGDMDARYLVVPVVLSYGVSLLVSGLIITRQLGLQHRFENSDVNLLTEPFPLGFSQLQDLLFFMAMTAILLHRFNRSRREQQRLSTEFDAARTVQQVLIPEDIPAIPGFEIRSIYRPFGEVGGDFFQIMAQDDGSVLIAIGDVSGKGLPAAMTVSLLVGTVRTLAHYTQSPGEILAAMNERMIGRNNGGFTTCLVLHVDRGGKITAANAGHISPYVDGKEVQLENGFPLGIDPRASYTERILDLPFNTQLTLLTDGVVEARNPAGELFGFERSQALSAASTEQIAQAALNFGQDDDITVLTLRRGAVDVSSTVIDSPVMA
jgi:sigma-B regulation protein RsbU (phosphoserine phosphatase)